MKPYYQDDSATLYLGDCRDILPAITPADLIVTDPPYGIDYRSGWGDRQEMAGDAHDGQGEIIARLALAIRQLGRGRHLYCFGPIDLSSLPLCGLVPLVWDKGIMGMGDLSSPWGSAHEPITFGVHEISAANRAKGRGGLAARIRKGSVIRAQRNQSGQNHRHPTEKPVHLLRQLIESSSVMGETVLDPFCGVGSTMVAAKLEGRRSIGIEIDEGYCRVAAERLAATASNEVTTGSQEAGE